MKAIVTTEASEIMESQERRKWGTIKSMGSRQPGGKWQHCFIPLEPHGVEITRPSSLCSGSEIWLTEDIYSLPIPVSPRPQYLPQTQAGEVGFIEAGFIKNFLLEQEPLVEYLPPTRAGEVERKIELMMPFFDPIRRLERANKYFRLKAAEAFYDEKAMEILGKLYEHESVRYTELSINGFGIALARLAAAGFCELGSESVRINSIGRRFVDEINESDEWLGQ